MEVIEKLYCTKCKEEYPDRVGLVKTGKRSDKMGNTVQYYWCRKCNRERTKSYYHKNKERVRAIIYKSIEKHKHKQRARELLNNHVNTGRITRPETCENCSVKDIVQGHHPDYSKPLEVMWLCPGCHAEQHKIEKRTN